MKLGELKQRIAGRIASEGVPGRLRNDGDKGGGVRCIPFRDYMEMCLYDPEEGYYRSGNVRVGREGDFYTSSAVGTVMGDKLAACMAEWIGRLGGRADVAEWGAGTGRLSGHVLAAWREKSYEWLSEIAYAVVDGNPVHLEEAENRLGEAAAEAAVPDLRFLAPEAAARNEWRKNKPLIVFANELLDAFPVHRVVFIGGELWEIGVAAAESRERDGIAFTEALMSISDPAIVQSLTADGIRLTEGQEAEVNLEAERWFAYAAGFMEEGVLVIIDYGHEAEELCAPHRMRGTLLSYRNHLAHDDPFAQPGGQDITAHVNFSACRRAAKAAGFEPVYFASQKQFLVDYGVLDDLTAHDGTNPFGEAARRNRSIRQLLLTDGMSELFKVMILQKR